jgi:hypothetical protein
VHALLDALVCAFLWHYFHIESERGYMVNTFVQFAAKTLQILKQIVLSRDLRMTLVMVGHLEEIVKTKSFIVDLFRNRSPPEMKMR